MAAPSCPCGSGALQTSQPQPTRVSYGSQQHRQHVQHRQHGYRTKAAWHENTTDLMVSTLGSFPGSARSTFRELPVPPAVLCPQLCQESGSRTSATISLLMCALAK